MVLDSSTVVTPSNDTYNSELDCGPAGAVPGPCLSLSGIPSRDAQTLTLS